ncbi:MAG: hypothetical protein ABII80_01000 [bacterium]
MKKLLISIVAIMVIGIFTTKVTAQTPSTTPSLHSEGNSYSLSFSSDPLRVWWPSYPNQYQQVDGAMWRDGDFTSLVNLKDLTAVWNFDPNYIVVGNTTSFYENRCNLNRTDLPCIRFVAHIQTLKLGNTSVNLKIYDKDGQEIVWNSYPIIIYDVSPATPSAVPSLAPTSIPGSPAPTINPSPSPTINPNQIREFEQRINYLEKQVSNQQTAIQKINDLLQKILNSLKHLIGWQS